MDYSKGKIYKIVCNITNEIYVGSTINTLNVRLGHHKKNNCISRQILERGDYKILLIENYPCKTKQDLLWRERDYIEKLDCINEKKPIITIDERKEKQKMLSKKQHAKRPIEYKEEKQIYDKSYREKNAEKKKLVDKAYYEKNREQIVCECGCTIAKFEKSRHIKSKKHQNLLQINISQN